MKYYLKCNTCRFFADLLSIKLYQSLIFIALVFLSGSCQDKLKGELQICFDVSSEILSYGGRTLDSELNNFNLATYGTDLTEVDADIFVLTSGLALGTEHQNILSRHLAGIKDDGYKIVTETQKVYIIAKNEKGGLYGMMDMLEQLQKTSNIDHIQSKEINPALAFRGIKFNLPWSPYRPGPATDLHWDTCRDLKFWEAFLDMMVKNRFNALTLWNTHPFPYMIRTINYPEATPFDDEELRGWQSFWRSLFAMAKMRGIETYLVNWNIVVSSDFAEAYGADEYGDTSMLVKNYLRESVTQVINEYPNLTGLGVTLADWMGNWGDFKMTPKQREDWISKTFVQGMKLADRKIKFIHRTVLAGDPLEMRKVIDEAGLPEKTIVEVKFNWSHGHSTPNLSLTHANNDGTIMRGFWDPKPENYSIAWMIRNEDFFVLRWGDPAFIRAHIRTNHHEYVDGYFIGSEGYIPAVDYSHVDPHPHRTWQYAFQKQWLFYHLWGRLTFNPTESDQVLAREFAHRYENINPVKLLRTFSLASKVPQYIASYYKGTWDFTLYSEGFMAAWPIGFDDERSPFISVEELMRHETLDAQLMNIREFGEAHLTKQIDQVDKTTPLELAMKVRENCQEALDMIPEFRLTANESTLQSELDDLETWCHLGLYFAEKLQAAANLHLFERTKDEHHRTHAINHLTNCREHWKQVVTLTKDRYQPMPYVSMGHHEQKWPDFKRFHWSEFSLEVERDIEFATNL